MVVQFSYYGRHRRVLEKKADAKRERDYKKTKKLKDQENKRKRRAEINDDRIEDGLEPLPDTPVKKRTARKPETDTQQKGSQKQIRRKSPEPIRATDDNREPISMHIDNNNLIDSIMPFDQPLVMSTPIREVNSEKPFVICALKNIGNTCFMNSALYCLRFLPTFLHNLHHFVKNIVIVFSDDVDTGDCVLSRASIKLEQLMENPANKEHLPKFNKVEKDKGYIIDQLHSVFESMVEIETGTRKYPLSPQRFRQMLYDFDNSFTLYDQHDAHECLKLLLTAIQEFSEDMMNKCKHMFASENDELTSLLSLNYFRDYFVGKRVMTLHCKECESTKSHLEDFVELFIPLTSNKELRENFIQNLCLKKQKLDGSNKVNCDSCIMQTEMTQSYEIRKMPLILIVQLGRFNEKLEKVDTIAPVSFELTCFCESCIGGHPEHRYSLVGVILHLGRTSKSGHYIAYVRAPEQDPPLQCSSQSCCQINVKAYRNEWYICNDDDITRITESDLVDKMHREAKYKTPYVLFYARNDILPVQ